MIYEAAGRQRNATSEETSLSSPGRRSGVRETMPCRSSSYHIYIFNDRLLECLTQIHTEIEMITFVKYEIL